VVHSEGGLTMAQSGVIIRGGSSEGDGGVSGGLCTGEVKFVCFFIICATTK
jgi:hypothetical protein